MIKKVPMFLEKSPEEKIKKSGLSFESIPTFLFLLGKLVTCDRLADDFSYSDYFALISFKRRSACPHLSIK